VLVRGVAEHLVAVAFEDAQVRGSHEEVDVEGELLDLADEHGVAEVLESDP
jgi:hypothetical protein